MNNMTTFYIIRHGTTEWNVKRLIQGHSDSPLTLDGVKIAQGLAKELKHIKFDLAFSSDLLRAKRTAEIIALEHNLAVKTTKLLRERKFGTIEGKSSSEFIKIDQILDKLTDEERYIFKSEEYAESNEEIIERFMTFVREIVVSHPGKIVLAVTHGGFIRTVLIKLGYGTYEELKHGAAKNGSYIKLESDGVDFFIKEVKGVEKQ